MRVVTGVEDEAMEQEAARHQLGSGCAACGYERSTEEGASGSGVEAERGGKNLEVGFGRSSRWRADVGVGSARACLCFHGDPGATRKSTRRSAWLGRVSTWWVETTAKISKATLFRESDRLALALALGAGFGLGWAELGRGTV